jgi:hypothetical protein
MKPVSTKHSLEEDIDIPSVKRAKYQIGYLKVKLWQLPSMKGIRNSMQNLL